MSPMCIISIILNRICIPHDHISEHQDRQMKAKSFMMDTLITSMYLRIYLCHLPKEPARTLLRGAAAGEVLQGNCSAASRRCQNKINAIKNSDLDSSEKWDKISSILEDTYNSMSETRSRIIRTTLRKRSRNMKQSLPRKEILLSSRR